MQKQIIEIQKPTSKILLDGVFFQFSRTGIYRVWKSLLEEWSKNKFSQYIIVLDRDGTAPKIPGICYLSIPPYDYNNVADDREMLQQVCYREGVDLFISSYYTAPIKTHSVLMVHDMLAEVLSWDLEHPIWKEKHHAIENACAYIVISENTAKDLVNYFPHVSEKSITIAKNGVNHQIFLPSSQEKINEFNRKYGINKPYFLLVGTGNSTFGSYKNSILFFQAFSLLASSSGFDIIITGCNGILSDELRKYTLGSTVYMLKLSDEELAIAYSGALSLVYPSKYEGFGMPIAEAMACGCPVISCPNASIPEVAGEAAIYVKDDDINGMVDAMCDIQKPSLRLSLISDGLLQSQKFSWTKMAQIVSSALVDAICQ